jgi:hypothetical protein
MTEDHDAFQQEAERAGLTRLSETHGAQFAKAKAAAEQLIRRIPRHLHMYDEPAHVFRALQRREHD